MTFPARYTYGRVQFPVIYVFNRSMLEEVVKTDALPPSQAIYRILTMSRFSSFVSSAPCSNKYSTISNEPNLTALWITDLFCRSLQFTSAPCSTKYLTIPSEPDDAAE